MVLPKTCEAFKEAGASDQLAREAAKEIAALDPRFLRVESRLNLVLGNILVLILGVAALVMRVFSA